MAKWMKIAVGALALLVVAATASGDSNTYNYQDNGTAKFNTRSGQIVDASGNAKVVDADRDRDLDYYATVINATTIDTAQATSYVLSGIIDVRKYSRGNVIIHINRAAADSFAVTMEYGVTLFALPTQSYDWTGYGVPLPAFFQPSGPLVAADSTGVSNLWQQRGGPAMALPVPITAGALTGGVAGFGERQVVLTTVRPNTGYLPYQWGNTVSAPWSWWLGSVRPRFLGIMIRWNSMTGTYANRPSVRVDVEALR